MRSPWTLMLGSVLAIAAGGCGHSDRPDIPTVDDFDGRLTHEGKPVSFPSDPKVQVLLFHHGSAESFYVPIKPDGTFDIGWMPIGKYSATLIREKAPEGGKKGPTTPSRYSIPEGLTIEEGQTQYEIELGKDWKP